MFHISFVSCLRSLIPLCGRKIFFSLAKYVSPGAQKNGFEMKYASLQAQVHKYPHSEMLITKACKHIYCTYERQAQTQKHTVTNTHGKQSNTKHERRLICRCSKHSGATEREMWKECVGTYPHSKAVTNKSFSICLQGLCVIYPIQYSTMLRGLSMNRPGLCLYIMYGVYANETVTVSKTFDLGVFVAPTVNAAKASWINGKAESGKQRWDCT